MLAYADGALVVVAEVSGGPDPGQVVHAIGTAVLPDLGLVVMGVLLVTRQGVPTASKRRVATLGYPQHRTRRVSGVVTRADGRCGPAESRRGHRRAEGLLRAEGFPAG
jgi:hypothetical protein